MTLASLDRNGTAILAAVLALLYVFLGATALGLSGVLGIAGGVVALALLAVRGRHAYRWHLALLAFAAIPFAALAWWSVAVPVIGALLFVMGALALHRPERR